MSDAGFIKEILIELRNAKNEDEKRKAIYTPGNLRAVEAIPEIEKILFHSISSTF